MQIRMLDDIAVMLCLYQNILDYFEAKGINDVDPGF